MEQQYFRLLHRLAVAGVVVTIALTIGIGGTITSAEVGMAYPTWPDINGGSLFSIFYGKLADTFGIGSVVEHTHRQAASLTGLTPIIAPRPAAIPTSRPARRAASGGRASARATEFPARAERRGRHWPTRHARAHAWPTGFRPACRRDRAHTPAA